MTSKPSPNYPPSEYHIFNTFCSKKANDMVLVNCPECNKPLSSKASACPHCGCPTADLPILKCRFCKTAVSAKTIYCPKCTRYIAKVVEHLYTCEIWRKGPWDDNFVMRLEFKCSSFSHAAAQFQVQADKFSGYPRDIRDLGPTGSTSEGGIE